MTYSHDKYGTEPRGHYIAGTYGERAPLGYAFPLLAGERERGDVAGYLEHLRAYLDPRPEPAARGPYEQEDIVSAILNRQIARRAMASSQLAELIQERRRIAQKHIADIDFRLEDVRSQLSILRMLHGPLDQRDAGTVERRLLDLERQKRQAQRQLWQDTAELEQSLLEQRAEYITAKRRMDMLLGDADGL